MNRRTILAAGPSLVVASLFAVACSSTGGAGQSTGASLAVPSIAIPSVSLPAVSLPASLPAVSLPAVSLPAGSLALPSGSFAVPSFSFPSEDKDLEARLPGQLNGVTLTKYSFKGQTFLQSGSSSNEELIALLASIGKSANDLSAAFAVDNSGAVQLGAIRIAGTDSGTLLNAFITSTKNATPEVQVTQGNVGGKNVNQIVDPTNTESGTTYAYANGDTLFFVQTKDAAVAASALQVMP